MSADEMESRIVELTEQLRTLETNLDNKVQVSYDYFTTNDIQIDLVDNMAWTSGSWCVKEGQTVELEFQATVNSLQDDVEILCQLMKTVDGEEPVAIAQSQIS